MRSTIIPDGEMQSNVCISKFRFIWNISFDCCFLVRNIHYHFFDHILFVLLSFRYLTRGLGNTKGKYCNLLKFEIVCNLFPSIYILESRKWFLYYGKVDLWFVRCSLLAHQLSRAISNSIQIFGDYLEERHWFLNDEGILWELTCSTYLTFTESRRLIRWDLFCYNLILLDESIKICWIILNLEPNLTHGNSAGLALLLYFA